MESLHCYLGCRNISGGLDAFVNHLRGFHGFICGQNGCQQRFYHFYNLRNHIKKEHLGERDNEDVEFQNENWDFNLDAGSNSNENEVQEPMQVEDVEETLNLRTSVVRMIGRLLCKGSMTGAI